MLLFEEHTVNADNIGANEPTEDELIESLKASNRELAHQLADLREKYRNVKESKEIAEQLVRDDYRNLYEDLIERLLERVNVDR